MFIAFVIFFYLNYPGVQHQFIEHEMSLMTPEQRAAVDQMQAAQLAMAKASVAPAPAAPAAATPAGPAGAAGAARRLAAPPAAAATRRGPRSTIERPTCDAGRPFSVPARGQSRTASTAGDRSTARRPEPPSASSHVDVRLRAEPRPLALRERHVAPGVQRRSRPRASSSPSRTAHASR